MKSRSNPSLSSLATILLLFTFCTGLLPAQAATSPAPSPGSQAPVSSDPTASTIPPAQFKIETLYDKPKFSIAAPVLLGTGLVATVVGSILSLFSATVKPQYDLAYNTWKTTPNSTTLAARDAESVNFFTPFLIGTGFNVIGIVLIVGGFDQGTGIKNLRQVKPDDPLIQASPSPVATASPAASPDPAPASSPAAQ